jgi:cytochrome P450
VPLLGWQATALHLMRDPVLHLSRLRQRYGDVVALGREVGSPVCVFGPEYNHQVLTDTGLFYCLDVTDSTAPLRMPRNTAASRLLTGLTGMNGVRHKQHRRLLLPAFHRERVELLADTIAACAERHVERWHVGQQIDLRQEMVELSLSVAIEGLLGLDAVDQGQQVRHLLSLWSKYGLSPRVMLFPWNLPGLPYRRFVDHADRLEAALLAVIESKKAQGLAGSDALTMLLQARDEDDQPLSGDVLLGHLTTLFTAGHETTASALTWILFLLSQHPHILSALREEIDAGGSGTTSVLEQTRRRPLLTNVIQEGLRMFPPGMWLVRTCTAPCTFGPYSLPAGTHIVISPAVTHYQADIYERPHAFLPRRWETISPSPYQYLPFGNGPRRCLGATFAMMEMQIVLPLILQRFHPVVPPNTRVDRGGSVLSLPRGGLPVVLQSPEQAQRLPAPRLRGNIHDLVELPEEGSAV